MKILLVEDEPKLNQFVKKGLEQNGYSVDSTTNGSTAIEMAAVTNYDLIILDLMLPGQSGFEVLDNMKRFNIKIPVMILSALNGSEHVIEGLDKGAIDYVKKPFDFGEFLARVRVIIRKGEPKQPVQLAVGNLELNLLTRKVIHEGNQIELTKREFSLLQYIMNNCNRVLSKTEIAEKIWEINFDTGSNVIEVHMSSLRKKIKGEVIKTKVGIGYYIEGTLIKK
ncbi:MAG TPA: response regulator transcription factor [Cyclobacteriaceae bacterium]|nr:response regulator transcription factor [Cyclobacteriaceae bacterium]